VKKGIRKKVYYPIWVNGKKINGIEEAAESVSILAGKKIEETWLLKQIQDKANITLHGVKISILGPQKHDGAVRVTGNNTAERHKISLLRFPPSDQILNRGLCRAQK
jgi:hypothetical protein